MYCHFMRTKKLKNGNGFIWKTWKTSKWMREYITKKGWDYEDIWIWKSFETIKNSKIILSAEEELFKHFWIQGIWILENNEFENRQNQNKSQNLQRGEY